MELNRISVGTHLKEVFRKFSFLCAASFSQNLGACLLNYPARPVLSNVSCSLEIVDKLFRQLLIESSMLSSNLDSNFKRPKS